MTVVGPRGGLANSLGAFLWKEKMSSDTDRPATKRDLDEAITRMEKFVLDRENGMLWRFLLLGLALLGAQWAAITWMMSHWKP